MTRASFLVVLLTAVACAVPLTGAAAKVECKGTVTSPLVPATDDVDSSWRTAVTNTYGADWADLGKAQNKRYYDVNLALAILHYMTAQPCKNVVIVPLQKFNGKLQLKQSP